MSSLRFFVGVLILLLPLISEGNLRAPDFKMQGSASMISGSYPSITVNGVVLDVDCQIDRSQVPGDSNCDITVQYLVVSDSAVTVQLQFIAPTSGEIFWTLGETSGQANFVFETYTGDVPAALLSLLEVGTTGTEEVVEPSDAKEFLRQIYRAKFEVALERGEQLLEIRYLHPPNYFEYDYGYFQSSKFMYSISYEVWPIKQWQFAEEFAMQLNGRFRNAVGGLWSNMRGRTEGMVVLNEEGERLFPDSTVRKGGDLIGQWNWDKNNLPDRFTLFLGRENRIKDASRLIPGEWLMNHQRASHD